MILFNKLIRIDLIFMTALLLLNFMKSGGLKDALIGFVSALLILTIINHVKHFQLNKKFF